MSPAARADLLHDLAAVVDRHQGHTVAGGLGAIRLLRQARATWTDLLGPAFRRDDPRLAAVGWGYRISSSPRDFGRAVLTSAAFATPYELGQAAVLAARGELTDEQDELLRQLLRDLATRRGRVVV